MITSSQPAMDSVKDTLVEFWKEPPCKYWPLQAILIKNLAQKIDAENKKWLACIQV